MRKARGIGPWLFAFVWLTACGKFSEEHPSVEVSLSTAQLEPAPSGMRYEAWLLRDAQAISLGYFSIEKAGQPTEHSFSRVDRRDLAASSTAFVTLEPASDDAPSIPSRYVVMAGEFKGDLAKLSVDNTRAFKTDFSKGRARFVLQTPTDGSGNPEDSGLWFYNGETNDPEPGLKLPKLPEGWTYEAVFQKDPKSAILSLGTFPIPAPKTQQPPPQAPRAAQTAVGSYEFIRGADSGNPYSAALKPAPAFPGEDFLQNLPLGAKPPLELSGGTLSIRVRDTRGRIPKAFVIYSGKIRRDARPNTVYELQPNKALPSGSLKRALKS